MAPNEEVSTTRLTPASPAARSTRHGAERSIHLHAWVGLPEAETPRYILTAGNGFRPPSIIFEISRDERQTIARFSAAFPQHGAHVRFPLQVPNRGPYLMTRGQELQDAMTADKP